MNKFITANTRPWHEAAFLVSALARTVGEGRDLTPSHSEGHLRTDKEVKTSLQWLHSVPCLVRKVASHQRWLQMLLTPSESKWQWHRNFGQTVVCTFPAGLRDPDTVHDTHTQCHICLLLCPSVMVAKRPGTSYSKPQVPTNYSFPWAVSTTVQISYYFLQEPLSCSCTKVRHSVAVVLYRGSALLTPSEYNSSKMTDWKRT